MICAIVAAAMIRASHGMGSLANQGRLGLASARPAQAYEILDTGINLGQGVANVADGNYTEGGIQLLAAGLGVSGAKAADDAIERAKAAKKAADDAAAAAKGGNAPTTGSGCPDEATSVKLSPSQQKAIRSYQNRIAEHREKLDAYKNNPDAFDNQGLLKNAPNEAARQRIIDGRVRHLEHEIKTFEENIRKIETGA